MVSQSCHKLLADFSDSASRALKFLWFPIISDGKDSLVVLLGIEYKQRYLPFMISCGLIKVASCWSKNYLTLSQKYKEWKYMGWFSGRITFHEPWNV